MGKHNFTQKHHKYISIYKGVFEMEVNEGHPGAMSRITKTGRVKYYLQSQSLTGKITLIDVDLNGTYGPSLAVKMTIDGQTGIITTPAMGTPALMLYRRMERINFGEDVTINLWLDTRKKFHVTRCRLFHGDAEIKDGYRSKAKQAAIPDWEAVEVNGQTIWNKDKALNYWVEKLETKIKPQLNAEWTKTKSIQTPKNVVKFAYVPAKGKKKAG